MQTVFSLGRYSSLLLSITDRSFQPVKKKKPKQTSTLLSQYLFLIPNNPQNRMTNKDESVRSRLYNLYDFPPLLRSPTPRKTKYTD